MNTATAYRFCLLVLIASLLWSLSGCEKNDAVSVSDFLQQEQLLRDRYQNNTVDIHGEVVDESGNPVEGALVAALGVQGYTDQQGRFSLQNLARKNVLLSVDATRFRLFQHPLKMQIPVTQQLLQLAPFILTAKNSNEARLLFGGDLSFARRFLDPLELASRDEIPADYPGALIRSSDPLPGSRQALDYIRSTLMQADFPVINFESPVTLNPQTPHPTKDFVYFSLPESLPALSEAGISYVSLGNNHVYDYLGAGLQDTLAYLTEYGFQYSGAGATPEEAFAPYEIEINGMPISLVSANSVSGSRYADLYVATDCNGVNYDPCTPQGGAADLNDGVRVTTTINTAQAKGHFVITQLHGGAEYRWTPSDYIYGRMTLAVESGADLVISHHPHVAQGFGYHNGVLIFEGLGNFLFDQDRHDTMLGLMAQVDVRDQQIVRAQGIPIYLEDYRPRRISGDLANRFIRHLSEFSRGNALSFPYQYSAWILNQGELHTKQTEQINHTITIGESRVGVVDLRHLIPSEASLARVSSVSSGLDIAVGRDILLYGDFEDYDIDNQLFEAARWDLSGSSRFACMSGAYQGVQGLCLVRDAQSSGDTVSAFRNRIRVMGDAENRPNKNLSLFGYLRGENSGEVRITVRYYASFGEEVFGEEQAYYHAGGDFPWQPLLSDLTMPEDLNLPQYQDQPSLNPRALRLFLRKSPTEYGGGMVAFDELAVINWGELRPLNGAFILQTPHAQDFLRIEAAPGHYTLQLTYETYRPE
ncbi:MAG: CapA family protein [Gammaproteobacteria bacterium]|nr:CapA family protein [Gammaproteobacteria bacterium]MCF6230008.1 CapA family protein [Gammaproteobacteria bacterium]